MPEGPAVGRGRSGAESIDDAEHGAKIESAMVDRPKLRSAILHFVHAKSVTRRSRLPCDSWAGCCGESGRTNVRVSGACGAFALYN
jgi:hypothetical protein